MICCLLAMTGLASGADPAWDPPPWGLNLEQLNQLFKQQYKDGQISEDKGRVEIEIPYSATKVMKLLKGEVVALLYKEVPSGANRLYGYAFEGKIFGKVNLFKDRPEIFPQTVLRALQKAYPQGRITPPIGRTGSSPSFEYKSDQIYVFTNDKGVYYYHPPILDRLVKDYQQKSDAMDQKFRDEYGSKANLP
jgi:hypothetical protein